MREPSDYRTLGLMNPQIFEPSEYRTLGFTTYNRYFLVSINWKEVYSAKASIDIVTD